MRMGKRLLMLVAVATASGTGGSLLVDYGTIANNARHRVYVSDKDTFDMGRLQIQEGYNER